MLVRSRALSLSLSLSVLAHASSESAWASFARFRSLFSVAEPKRDDGHLAQNKERHADRFTRFKYCWERLTPQASVMLLKEHRTVCCFVSLLRAVVCLGGRRLLEEKLWDKNLLCRPLSVHRGKKARAQLSFFLEKKNLFLWNGVSSYYRKNIMQRN